MKRIILRFNVFYTLRKDGKTISEHEFKKGKEYDVDDCIADDPFIAERLAFPAYPLETEKETAPEAAEEASEETPAAEPDAEPKAQSGDESTEATLVNEGSVPKKGRTPRKGAKS